jgi:CHAT domain-containing protein/tetratricopeptide (TPR) repeat protein
MALLVGIQSAAAQIPLRKQAETAIDSAVRLRSTWKADSMRNAIKEYRKALRIFEQLLDVQSQAKVHLGIGESYQALSQSAEAFASYRQAITLSRKDPQTQADALNALAYLHWLLGENKEALESSEKAHATSVTAGYVSGEAHALINLAETYYGLGELPKAVQSYDEGMRLLIKLGDRETQVKALVGQGYTFVELSETEKALAAYQQALALSRAISDRRLEAISLRALGNLRNLMGDKQEALTTLSLALKTIEGIDDLPTKADVFGGLGFLYDGLGEKALALDYYEQSQAIFRTMNHRWGTAEIGMVIAGIHYSSGDYNKALYYCQESLAMFRAMVMPRYEAWMLRDIGLIYDTRGDKKKALEFFNQALAVAKSGQDQRYTAQTLNYMGRSYASTKDWQAALSCYEQALGLSRIASDGVGESATLYNLARLEAARENLDVALSHAQAALKISESLRTKVQSHELRATYFGTVYQQFNLYTDILMRLHQKRPNSGFDAMAFEANERGRARSMLEVLAESRAGIRQGVDQSLLRRESQLQRQLNATVERRIKLAGAKASNAEMAEIERELSELTTAYQQVQGEIRNSSPRYAALVQPTPLTLKKIQQQVLDNDTALLAFALGEERSFAWLVTSDSIKSFELDPRAEIEKIALRLYTHLTARNQPQKDETPSQRRARVASDDAQYLDVSRELSTKLLGDVAKHLRQQRLVIVADGALQYVPFAALPTPAATAKFRPLIADYEIVSLPSASVLALMREDLKARPRAPKSVAILADPVFDKDDPRLASLKVRRSDVAHAGKSRVAPLDQAQRALRDFNGLTDVISRLPFSGREAEAIMALVPAGEGMLALGFRASRATAIGSELSQYRYVHFATHGLLNSKHPELSGVFLSRFNEFGKSQDGFLQLHDVYNLKLSADLVVLSACQTALGKDIRGEGLVGLTRGFMYAGAPRVVASLWQVDDAATADLMREFYTEMLTKGKRPAEALRAAQVRMWEQNRWPSPYYWAAFTLQGEWR